MKQGAKQDRLAWAHPPRLTGGIRFRVTEWRRKIVVEVEEECWNLGMTDTETFWRYATLEDMVSLGIAFPVKCILRLRDPRVSVDVASRLQIRRT